MAGEAYTATILIYVSSNVGTCAAGLLRAPALLASQEQLCGHSNMMQLLPEPWNAANTELWHQAGPQLCTAALPDSVTLFTAG